MNRNETQDSLEPRIDRRFWFGPPAVVDTGAERFALRRIQIVHDTPDVVDVEVSFLNKPAIHRQVTETRRECDSLWLLATDGPLFLSRASDADFEAFSDIEIPPPPGAIPALVTMMEEAIVEWEGDEDGAPAEPIYWDSEGGAHEELDAVVAYASAGHFVEADPVADVHYIVNQRNPIYGARWRRSAWEQIPADQAIDHEAEFVTIERGNERAFLDLFKVHPEVPYGLAILAGLPRGEAIQVVDLDAGMRKWMGTFSREFQEGDHIFPGFLEGQAEIYPEDVFFSIKEAWVKKLQRTRD